MNFRNKSLLAKTIFCFLAVLFFYDYASGTDRDEMAIKAVQAGIQGRADWYLHLLIYVALILIPVIILLFIFNRLSLPLSLFFLGIVGCFYLFAYFY